MKTIKTAQDSNSSPEFRLIRLRQNEPNGKLGFSLRGGKEATGCSVGVFVSHVELTGQADKNGLKVGDQLIQVNGLQVSQATYDEVIELIRRAPKSDDIHLLVTYVGRIPFQEKSGEPIKWLQIGDMLAITPDNHVNNVANVNDINHRFKGTDLKQINGYATTSMGPSAEVDKEPAASSYDSAASSQSLTFTSSSSSSTSSHHSDEDDDECRLGHNSGSSSSSGCSISMSSVQSSNVSGGDIFLTDTPVRVPGGRQTCEPFGCGVVKGPDEWPGIFVQHVKEASLAERVGLQPGDQLVKAEQYLLSQMSFEEAIKLIKHLQAQQDELLLLVRKGAALEHLANNKRCKRHPRPQSAAIDEEANIAADAELIVDQAATVSSAEDKNKGANCGLIAVNRINRRPLPRAPIEAPPSPPIAQTNSASGHEVCKSSERLDEQQQQWHKSISSIDSMGRQACDSEISSTMNNCLRSGTQMSSSELLEAAPNCAPKTRSASATSRHSTITKFEATSSSIERFDPLTKELGDADEHLDFERQLERESLDHAMSKQRQTHQSVANCLPVCPAASNLLGSSQNESSIGVESNPRRETQTNGQVEKDLRMASKKEAREQERIITRDCNENNSNETDIINSSDDDDDNEQENEGQISEIEEIKIVRQSCKLHHHNSSSAVVQNLVKMTPFAEATKRTAQNLNLKKQAQSGSCKTKLKTERTSALQQQIKRAQQQQQADTRSIGPCRLHGEEVANILGSNYTTPGMQRYVSVDNLTAVTSPYRCSNLSVSGGNQQARHSKVQQSNLQQKIHVRHQQQALPSATRNQLNPARESQMIYRRSNSVLGQSGCCPMSLGSQYILQHQQQQRRVFRDDLAIISGHYKALDQVSNTCGCVPNSNLLKQQQQRVSSVATMRHFQSGGAANQRLLSASTNPASSTNKYLKKQSAHCNTLAMSRLKARSEDKLNLMINMSYVQSLSGRMLRAKQRQQVQNSCGACCQSVVSLLDTTKRNNGTLACNQSLDIGSNFCNTTANPTLRHQQQQVFQYATAMGMISSSKSQARQQTQQQQRSHPIHTLINGCVMSEPQATLKSCCALDRLHCRQAEPPIKRATQLVDCAPFVELGLDDPLTSSPCPCDTLSCASNFCCPSEQRLMLMRHNKTQASDKRRAAGGTSTDSSGYQSGGGGQTNSRPACQILVDCHQASPSISLQRDTSQKMSTFSPSRPASRLQLQPVKSSSAGATKPMKHRQQLTCGRESTTTKLIMIAGSQCSSACSGSSSSCSPASSPPSVVILNTQQRPDRNKHESLSSPPSSAVSSRSSSPLMIGKQLIKSAPAPAPIKVHHSKKLKAGNSNNTSQSIPCPPPMPIVGPDGRTLTRPSAIQTTVGCDLAKRNHRDKQISDNLANQSQLQLQQRDAVSPSTKQKLARQQQWIADDGEEHATSQPIQSQGQVQGKQQQRQIVNNKSNRLCFVDELKMLANGCGGSQQVAPESSSKSGPERESEPNHIDSSTLIKLINANNKAAAATASNNQRQQQLKKQQLNCPSCCQASKSGQFLKRQSNSACCYNQIKQSAPCAGQQQKERLGQESKSVKLRDEEDNKRRQHELLMEEFKKAHSKMFNKLRQAAAKIDEQQGGNISTLRDNDDKNKNQLDDDHEESGECRQVSSSLAAINKEEPSLMARPRTSIAS